MRASVGTSLIWDSPFGALHVDYAYPISKNKYVTFTDEDREKMCHVARFDAKNPHFDFKDDSEDKRRTATDLVRRMADTWVKPVYERLEAGGTGDAGDSGGDSGDSSDEGRRQATDHPLYEVLKSSPNPLMDSMAFREGRAGGP